VGPLTRCRLAAAVVIAVTGAVTAVPSAAQAAPGDLATVAGNVVPSANATSIAIGARGVAVSGTTLYIADTDSNAIRKVDLSTGIATVVAGMGAPNNAGDNGQAVSGGLNNPSDVTLDGNGDLLIAATSNARIRKVTLASGVLTTVAGTTTGNSGDGGPATLATLNNPASVAVAPNGDYYIADTDNAQVRKVTAATGIISTFASGLAKPYNIAFDSTGNVFVTDCVANTIIRYPAAGGAGTVVAGAGGLNAFAGDGGPATAARLGCPAGIYIDTSDVIYFSDAVNNRIRTFTVDGTISTFAGTGTAGLSGDGGLATAARLDRPTDLTRDAVGNFYIAQGNLMDGTSTASTSVVRRISATGIITTVAGNTWRSYSGDGAAAVDAQLGHPGGVAVDSTDNLYIADTANNRIRRVTPGGTISTLAGNGLPCTGACTVTDIGDGGAATAGNLFNPQAVTVTGTGDVYIADTGHHRIRRVAAGVVSTTAGTGVAGWVDGPVATARFRSPHGIFAAANGDIYLADQGNHRIRRISGGTVTTIAGSGTSGYTGDGGPATSAALKGPSDVRVDATGDIYIADTGNHVIRRIRNGVITTVAGTGVSGSTGDGGLAVTATLNGPAGIEVDRDGNVYVADTGNQTVRRVDRHGVIHHLAGRAGSTSWAGDGGPGAASVSRLFSPARMALASTGNLYIPSAGEMRVRELAVQTAAPTFWVSSAATAGAGVTYGWEFVSRSTTAFRKITFTVPSATNTNATGLYVVSAVDLPTSGTLSLSGGLLTYTLPSDVSLAVGQHVYLSVNGFTNTGTIGNHYSTISTLTSGGATVNSSSSGAVAFAPSTSAVLVLPNPNELVTVSGTTTVYVDPMLGGGDTIVNTPLTIQTNATRGYTLSIRGTALTGTAGTILPVSTGQATAVATAAFGVNRIGYTVTGVGGSGAGSAAGALSGAYAGHTAAGETVVTATRPTSVTGDVVALAHRVRINSLLTPGSYTSTVSYSVTPAY
jgi:sugar lactone lactonase YvrE